MAVKYFISDVNDFYVLGYGFIDQLEKELGKPVITSNQAMIWHCLKLCKNITDDDLMSVKGYGVLFKNPE